MKGGASATPDSPELAASMLHMERNARSLRAPAFLVAAVYDRRLASQQHLIRPS